jgi:5,10-methylenetetrahydromethanopterin reductase
VRFSAELSPRCGPSQIREHARAIEECGFDRIWIRDMLIAPWEMWTAATTVALSTERIRVGTDVTNPYTRSPVVTAHAAATLDQLSGGRLDLGLGQGIGEFLEAMGIEKHDAALAESIPILRDLLAGKRVTQRGEAFSIRGVRLPVAAAQERLPLWVATMGEEGFRLAGELADGLLTISANRQFLEEARSRAGREQGWPIATWLPYSTSREELCSYLDDLFPRMPGELLEAMGLDRELVSREELLDNFALVGPEDLEAKGKRLEALGVSEIVIEYLSLEDLESLKGRLGPGTEDSQVKGKEV